MATKSGPKAAAPKERKAPERIIPGDMTFSVDSGIDFPSDDRGRESVYPWEHMKHGDSFAIPVPMDTPDNKIMDKLADMKRALSQSGRLWLKRAERDGWRVIVKIDPKNSRAVRVWMKDESGKDASAK